MNHALITIVIPMRAVKQQGLDQLLDKLGKTVGSGRFGDQPRPQGIDHPARLKLREFVHFMSMVLLPSDDDFQPHLIIEVNADGKPAAVIERLVDAIPHVLASVVEASGYGNLDRPALVKFLKRHRIKHATMLFATPGMSFTGTPGMSVSRIRGEWKLSLFLRRAIEDKECPRDSALSMLRFARSRIFEDADLKWAFAADPIPLLGPAKQPLDLKISLVCAAFRDALWAPLLIALLWAFRTWVVEQAGPGVVFRDFLFAVALEVVVFGAIYAVGYKLLRRQERHDVPADEEPPRALVQDLMSRENLRGVAQNHLAGLSVVKPGWYRQESLRIALWSIAQLIRGRSKPGYLDRIGSIHFARWIVLPGTNRLLFLSNYNGTWESYLEDFIARLREGLTSIWSNTLDFPKTDNLYVGGANDGARFKRWARHQQKPTRFWYCAYPQLTTSRIRTNAAIRHGFASASSESQAAQWLSLFGHVPPTNVQKDEVCPLVFGGLPILRFAHCLLLGFKDDQQARHWFTQIKDEISFGEHAQLQPDALVIGFTAQGLLRFGLDATALSTFPVAFQDGMAAENRVRALGEDNTSNWSWGRAGNPLDAVLIIYASDATGLLTQITCQKGRLGTGVLRCEVPLRELPARDERTGELKIHEPFGFRDGISQPIMRGSRHWKKAENAIHLVEPGELILGYKDNRGNLNPLPTWNGAEFGRNGTFLVLRQLEQEVSEFNKFVADQARLIAAADDPRNPGFDGDDLEHWVAARMVGRWKDGSSLLRNSHPPEPAVPEVTSAIAPASRRLRPVSLRQTARRRASAASLRRVAARQVAKVPVPHSENTRVPDNEFHFGLEDPDGLRCPLGAHVRRANPRDSFEPGSATQLDISNRHRILRVGREYVPPLYGKRGLMFMCINADIERQFEFVHQTWLFGPNFHGLEDEIDPIVGYRGRDDSMSVPTQRGPVRFKGLSKFVNVLGGGYFFVPGKQALGMLADAAKTAANLSPAQTPAPARTLRRPHCGFEPYSAPWWLPGAHLQTILAPWLVRDGSPSTKRTRWRTPANDDFIDVDWAGPKDARRLLVIFHGLEGGSKSHYVRALVSRALELSDWRCAVPHFRGCSGEPNELPRAYHAGDSAEIDWILQRFKIEHGGPVYAVGASLGGNALLKWLGESGAGAQELVQRAVAISAPFDLAAFGNQIGRGFNRIYGWYFLYFTDLRRKAQQKIAHFPEEMERLKISAQRVDGVTTLPAFDDAFTAPLHGFNDKMDYWTRSSAGPHLANVRVPLLLLNARNDPFLPESALLKWKKSLPSNVNFEFPEDGGHAGFPDRDNWLARRVLDFLSRA